MSADPQWTYPRARALRVHDGDTVKLEIDCGLSTFRIIWIRLAHINTPELSDAGGAVARDRLAELLSAGPLQVTTTKDKTEKYGRYLAEIVNSDGVDVAQQLIQEGLGRPYEGGRR